MSDGIEIPSYSTDDNVAWVWSDSHIDAGWATHAAGYSQPAGRF